MSELYNSQPQESEENFLVIGIGTSEGGLDSLRIILSVIPPDSGMAYIILSTDYSNQAEILTCSTQLPVEEIINEIDFKPNHIYVIPENNDLITVDGTLKLDRRKWYSKNDFIDTFFTSLAEVYKSFTVGIILSGKGFDGTVGLKKIKEEGGITIAQEPTTAAFIGMPQNAIAANAIDFILPPENIPEKLIAIRDSYEMNCCYNEEDILPKDKEETLHQIINLISLRSGIDFQHYKQSTIRRRIACRMVLLRKKTLLQYFHALQIDKVEQDSLFNDLLIPITYFFKDKHFFEALPKEVFPQLVKNAIDNKLRIWIPGCSTGEEVYSLAVCLHGYLIENNGGDIKVQLFGTDISEKGIAKARRGIYSKQDVQSISEIRLANYFTKRDGSYEINKVIRDMCVFAVHNLTKDLPFDNIDMVLCSNVLMYFNPLLQHKSLESFHFSLKEKGLLLLGESETAFGAHSLFESIGQDLKVYMNKTANPDTSPEKYQSYNQEIKFINDELINRQEQLTSLRNYTESIINGIKDPVIFVDENFTIKNANPYFYTYFDTTEKEAEGQSLFQIGNCQWDIPQLEQLVDQMLGDTLPTNDYRIEIVCPKAGKKILKVNAQYIADIEPKGIILIALKDITEVVKANSLLAAKNEELKMHNAQLQAFSSSASNDLQEPLRKMHMFCSRIIDNDKNLSSDSKLDLNRVMTSISNMQELISDLIDFTKAAVVDKTDYKKTDLNLVMKKTLADIKDFIAEKKAVVTVVPLPNLMIIPHQIQRLFSNLIINSTKYAKEGTVPQIKIEAEDPSREEIDLIGGYDDVDYIKITVKDNGIGFNPKYANRIFDPFYKLNSKDSYHGSGLGLTLSKKIVMNHKGFIIAESRENEGAIFSTYLPLN